MLREKHGSLTAKQPIILKLVYHTHPAYHIQCQFDKYKPLVSSLSRLNLNNSLLVRIYLTWMDETSKLVLIA